MCAAALHGSSDKTPKLSPADEGKKKNCRTNLEKVRDFLAVFCYIHGQQTWRAGVVHQSHKIQTGNNFMVAWCEKFFWAQILSKERPARSLEKV